MDSLWQDVRYAVRVLTKNPGFTAIAVLVLALGIGANTSIFTLTNSLLLRPIEAQNPSELVAIYSKDTARPDSYRAFSYPNYLDIRDLNTTFTDLMAHDLTIVGLTDGESTRRVFAEIVTRNYFDTFGVDPARGRFFTAAEETPDAGVPVVVVSYEFWRRAGQQDDLIGDTVEVNGLALEIVGVAPRNFTGRTAMMSPALYVPLGLHGRLLNSMFQQDGRPLDDRENHRLLSVGRLRPGVTVAEANEQLATLATRLEERFPAINENQTLMVAPLSRMSISTAPDNDRGQLSMVFLTLLGMTGVVLLLACINLANMLLARGATRRKEFAIRAAIGGGRGRIVRQLLTEGVLLSLLGGLAGLVAASWVNRLLASSITDLMALNSLSFDVILRSGPDLRVLVATAAFCLVGTLLFALGPAWQQSRPDVMEDLKQQGAGSGRSHGRGTFSRRNLLVASQIALSLVLLISAGLFIRAAFEAADVDPGFELERGLLVEVDPSLIGYDDDRSRDLYRQLHGRLAAIPGIEHVSVAATVPFGSVSMGERVRRAEDQPRGGEIDVESFSATSNIVGADYFDALGVEITRGRPFTRAETDSDTGNGVVIIDELLASSLWPDADAVGRRVGFGRSPDPSGSGIVVGLEPDEEGPVEFEVVGVVRTVRDDLFPSEARPHVYKPFGQNFQAGMNIHLRTGTDDGAAQADLLAAVRREIRAVDAQMPVVTMRTLRAHLDESFSLWLVRLGATIFTIFGSLALFLAVVGVYGVKAYTVAQRTREIGLRKALGATSRGTLHMMLRESMAVTAVGLAVGLVLAVGVGQVLNSMLYEVSGLDPVAFLGAVVVLAAAAFVATYLPARKASGIAPIVALRQD